MKVISVLVLAAIAAVTYRMGGSSNYHRWIRPVGLASCACLALMSLGYIHWVLILTFGAFYGMSTSYYKAKEEDATWINWLLVGLAFSLSVLPCVLVYHLWLGFAIRTVVCTTLIVIWSETNGNVVWEEGGRGVIPIITLPLLLIGA
jgi:hypothetical protein